MSATMNNEGLTLTEWLDAAGERNTLQTRTAWRRCEDPSEWRAFNENAREVDADANQD